LLKAKADALSALAITESLAELTVAIDRLQGLASAIEAATAQAKQSSGESSNLSKKLNRLTIWIAIAALGSAAGTILQAVVAIRHW
jgi:hypothetical protein